MTTYPPVGQGVLAELEGAEDGSHATDGQRHLVAVLAGQTGDALAEGLAEAAVLMMVHTQASETGACDVDDEHLGHAMGIMTPVPVGSSWAQPPPPELFPDDSLPLLLPAELTSSFPTSYCLCCCLRNSPAPGVVWRVGRAVARRARGRTVSGPWCAGPYGAARPWPCGTSGSRPSAARTPWPRLGVEDADTAEAQRWDAVRSG